MSSHVHISTEIDATYRADHVAAKALQYSKSFDVSAISYGRAHWGTKKTTKETPAPYYGFLAGLVASHRIHRICEIGTHEGGATRAMAKGLTGSPDARIVTVDITRDSDQHLRKQANITKVTGDAVSANTVARVLNSFSENHKIGLLFIDASHKYLTELLVFSIYIQALSPEIVVIDDINLNADMQNFWKKITSGRDPSTWIDVSTMYPEVRSERVGFGLLTLPENRYVAPMVLTVPVVSNLKKRVRRTMQWMSVPGFR